MLHVVLLPELVDVAHGGHGGVLVAGSLTAAPPSRVCCSELVLLWGPSTGHTVHTPQHGSYKIVHLNLQLSKILKVLSYNVGCVHLHQNIILYF